MTELILKLNEKYNLDKNILSKVSFDISPDDEMLGPGGKLHYFNVGLSGIYWILKSIIFTGQNDKKIKNILDFPCGCGRVLRFLKAFFPDSEITASEIEPKYLDFCKSTFGVNTVISDKNFEKINFNRKFDLIWCGSLFTHLNSRKFKKLLKLFYNHLENNGLLIFSSHGRFGIRNIKDFDYGLRLYQKTLVKLKYYFFGYGYVNYLRKFGYGVSFINPSWIYSKIQKFSDLRLFAYVEKAWDSHHDIIVCKREKFIC